MFFDSMEGKSSTESKKAAFGFARTSGTDFGFETKDISGTRDLVTIIKDLFK